MDPKVRSSIAGTRRRRWPYAVAAAVLVPLMAAGIGYRLQWGRDEPYGQTPYEPIRTDVSLNHLAGHPAFAGFGEMMRPFAPGMTTTLTGPLALDRATAYLDWDADSIVVGINLLIEQVNSGRLRYLPLYSEPEITEDDSRSEAGILFVPGRQQGPLAVVMAGGGWRAQANIQESFPLAARLHQQGYNVGIVRYRIGVHAGEADAADDPSDGRTAAVHRSQEDLAAAVRLIERRSAEWGVRMSGYSVWGSSAGGLVAMQWGSDGPWSAQAQHAPRPAAILAAYPPDFLWQQSAEYPPLFVVAAADDPLVPIEGTDRIVTGLRDAGRTVEYRRVGTGGHGFGLGAGTEAEGWADESIAFWEANQ